MAGPQQVSAATAVRIALAAQGFTDPVPTGQPDRRHLRRVLGRTQLFQIDSVNVFERAHYLPAFSRLGPYRTSLLDELAYRHRELYEYWGHEASLLPVELQPLLRWRADRARELEEGWSGVRSVARTHPELVAGLLDRLREEGPASAGDLREGPRRVEAWWGWDPTKVALEYLFWSGQVTTHSRRGFERVYDLTERVLPAAVLATPTPSREEAQQELIRRAAASLGVGTERDLRDYFRLRPQDGRDALHALVHAGELQRVEVQGWDRPAFLWPAAAKPRAVHRSALLSPFDPMVWERSRASRLFGIDYRIEIYTPAARRVHGYYVLPFLHEERIAARVDLKSDRAAGVLRVAAAWSDTRADDEAVTALASQLHTAARWQGLAEVEVAPRGDLADRLARAVEEQA